MQVQFTKLRPPSNYWGSAEEFEVQYVLKEIINCIDSDQCTDIVLALRNKLQTSGYGWIDRFVASQGLLVLHKLLYDIHSGTTKNELRELYLIQCMYLIFDQSAVAHNYHISCLSEQISKTLLRSLLSNNEETRELTSRTVLKLKGNPCHQSKVLHTLTLTRLCKDKSNKIRNLEQF